MLRHIVLFQLADGLSDEERAKAQEALEGLAAQIPEIVRLRVARAALPNPSGFDLVLEADFAGEDEYRRYGANQDHQYVWQSILQPITSQLAAIQYEVESATP